LALTRAPKIKYLIIIGGARFRSQPMAKEPYANKIKIPSLHFLGTSNLFCTEYTIAIAIFVD
jgi:hypothetical protein